VPGRVTDRLSDGCNKMLKDGAHVFLSPQDFLMDLQELLPFAMKEQKKKQCMAAVFNQSEIGRRKTGNGSGNSQMPTCGNENDKEDKVMQAILEVLDFYPKSMEEIALKLRERYQIEHRQEDLTTKLMYMCLYGLAKQETPGWFSK